LQGGVNQETAGNFILSGAEAIGIGTELIPTEAIARRQSDRIKELARRFRRMVNEAREQIEVWQQGVVLKEFTGTEECEQ
jgi:2-dehydro-3-deoxyphosphogluconate aldolase/(4S)-4-hydroxy-2-oxoglutarate aldolase